MKKAILIGAAALMVLSAAAWCQAPGGAPGGAPVGQPGGNRGGFGGNTNRGGFGGFSMSAPSQVVTLPSAQMVDFQAQNLGLTADQQTKLKDVLTKGATTCQPFQTKADAAAQALRTALTASTFDPKNIKALAATASKAETDLVNARVDVWYQIRTVLTADQAAKLTQGRGFGGFGGGTGFGGNRGGGNAPGGNAPSGTTPGAGGGRRNRGGNTGGGTGTTPTTPAPGQ